MQAFSGAAARTLNVGPDAATSAGDAQLLEIASLVRFHHPLVRSAAYTAASQDDRRAAHLALAGATDREIDPDRRGMAPRNSRRRTRRRSGGRAGANREPGAGPRWAPRGRVIASALGCADRKPARRRSRRTLAAAYANAQAGAYDAALGLLAQVEADAVDELQLARAEQIRGQIYWAASPGPEAPVALLDAAKRLEPLNVALARETYLHAWVASTYAGPLAQPGGHLVAVSRAARSTGASDPVRPCDHLLDGLIALVLDHRERAAPNLRRVVDAFASSAVAVDDMLQWGELAQTASIALWDIDSYLMLSSRQVEAARESGALSLLSAALGGRGAVLTWCGDFGAASALADERNAVNAVTGTQLATSHDMFLSAYRGRPSEAIPLVSTTVANAVAHGEGWPVQIADWSTAVLYNGLGQYEDAVAAAEKACEETYMVLGPQVALPELIEAALPNRQLDSRSGCDGASVGNDGDHGLGLGCGHRCTRTSFGERQRDRRALVRRVDRVPRRTPLRPELARSRLLYGEWLRRANRRIDAREQLRTAHDAFVEMGAEAFAERRPSRVGGDGREGSQSATKPRAAISPPRKSTSSGSPKRDAPMPRSVPSSSSACEPSNGTCAKCSPNSASPLVASSKSSSRCPIRSAPRRSASSTGSSSLVPTSPEARLRDCAGHVALLDVRQASLCARSIQANLSIIARMPVNKCSVTRSASKASIAV